MSSVRGKSQLLFRNKKGHRFTVKNRFCFAMPFGYGIERIPCYSVLLRDIFTEAHDDGSCLRTRCGTLRRKCAVSHAVDESGGICPGERCLRVAADGAVVGEVSEVRAFADIISFVGGVTIEDGTQLFAGDRIVWRESIVIVTVYDVILFRPGYGIGIPGNRRYVCEGGSGNFRLVFQTESMVTIMPRVVTVSGLNVLLSVPVIRPCP